MAHLWFDAIVKLRREEGEEGPSSVAPEVSLHHLLQEENDTASTFSKIERNPSFAGFSSSYILYEKMVKKYNKTDAFI